MLYVSSTSIWECITTPSSGGPCIICMHHSRMSYRGHHAEIVGIRIFADLLVSKT